MSNRTSKEMYPLIAQWEKSGKSKQRFCEEIPMNIHTFKYWLKKRNKNKSSKAKKSSTDFIELKVENLENRENREELSNSKSLFAEIDYPNGVALRLHERMSSKDLKELLKKY